MSTGTNCSVLPHVSDAQPTCHLSTIGGFLHRAIDVGHGRADWKFLIADVSTPILGMDYLAANRLALDMTRQQLVKCHPASQS